MTAAACRGRVNLDVRFAGLLYWMQRFYAWRFFARVGGLKLRTLLDCRGAACSRREASSLTAKVAYKDKD